VLHERWRFWPSGVGLRGRASNHPVLRWLKTVVVSDRGKGPARSDQVGTRKTFQSIRGHAPGVAVEALLNQLASKPGVFVPLPG
jgi:hypothetical protein